jgi:hypothetical protein
MTQRNIQNMARLRVRWANFAGRRRRVGASLSLGLLSLTLCFAGLFLVCPSAHAQGSFEEMEPSRLSGQLGNFRSFGATRRFYRVGAGQAKLPLRAADAALLQPDTIRLFKLNAPKQRWELVPESKYDPRNETISASLNEAGIYTAIGASRFEEVFTAQQGLCKTPPRPVAEICTLINCPASGFDEVAEELTSDFPFAIEGGTLARGMGNVCEACTRAPQQRVDFPECQLPGLKPGLVAELIPWPFPTKSLCFDAGNVCSPGPFKIGQVNYDFEDEFNLIPSGSTTPAYPNVDVRATVRYPATVAGTGQPVAGTERYPLVVFLHGNHATCPCSCSHTCPKASRIPNHLGYNYLLDLLASWGFIAVSIDGFDVTCAGSIDMSDYEARGRLVLRHLQKWQGWDTGASSPWATLFKNRVNMAKIGLSGHSRGGEGVVAAEFINRTEGLGFGIKAVNAIAPTDQDPDIRYVPQVPYFLLLSASDGDVSNLQGLRTYDRTSVAGISTQSEKTMAWVYGANHNFFNTVWTPGTGASCSSDDGTGDGRLSDSLQRLVGCQGILPFFRLHLRGQTGFRKMFRGEVALGGLGGVRMYWAYQHPVRREVDNFEVGNNQNTNSLGGAVTTTGGFSSFSEFNAATTPLNFHFTRGLLLAWNANQNYETVLPLGQRNVSGFSAVSMRVSQVLDAGVLNKLDSPRTLLVSLKSTGGTVSNVNFDVAGFQSVPYPYEGNGGKTVLGTVRIPLSAFRNSNVALPLNDIERIIIQYRGSGKIAVDDIQFTK